MRRSDPDIPVVQNGHIYSSIREEDVFVVGQNEIQVKMKFLCLLTLIIHGS